jgi:hypothetical protein
MSQLHNKRSRIGVAWAIPLFALLFLGWLLWRKHPLGTDFSRDGQLRADYSYRVGGLPELVFAPKVNVRAFLEVTDVGTGKVHFRANDLCDEAELAQVRAQFATQLPLYLKEKLIQELPFETPAGRSASSR